MHKIFNYLPYIYLFCILACSNNSPSHAQQISIIIDKVIYQNKPDRLKVHREYDGYIFLDPLNMIYFKYGDTLTVDINKQRDYDIKCIAYLGIKEYVFYLPAIAEHYALRLDNIGLKLISTSGNKYQLNWMYDLEEGEYINDKFWNSSVPLFLRSVDIKPSELSDKYRSERIELTDIIRNAHIYLDIQKYPYNEHIQDWFKAYDYNHRIMGSIFYGTEDSKTLYQEILSSKNIEVNLQAYELIKYKLKNSKIQNNTYAYFQNMRDYIQMQPINDTLKKILNRRVMSEGYENLTNSEFRKLLSDYILLDSLYASEFIKERGVDMEGSNLVELTNLNNENMELTEVTNKLKGNYIYIDIWASWCAPCKKSIPETLKLIAKYKHKDIKFIFLAYNDKRINWLSAVKQLKMDQYVLNYYITNSKSSNWFEEINLKTIPRYLLLDKSGEIKLYNAPAPGSKQMEEVLKSIIGM